VSSYFSTSVRPYCKYCGVSPENNALHREYHESMNALIRHILAPELTDQEWQEKINSPGLKDYLVAKREQRITEVIVEKEVEDVLLGATVTVDLDTTVS
jgi:hypothetical protein